MEAAAIPLPRPDRTPPVTIIYLAGISGRGTKSFSLRLSGKEFIHIRIISQGLKLEYGRRPAPRMLGTNRLDPASKTAKMK